MAGISRAAEAAAVAGTVAGTVVVTSGPQAGSVLRVALEGPVVPGVHVGPAELG